MREKDRACNQYPQLHYPELYVLKGGYREFFPQYQVSPPHLTPLSHGLARGETSSPLLNPRRGLAGSILRGEGTAVGALEGWWVPGGGMVVGEGGC